MLNTLTAHELINRLKQKKISKSDILSSVTKRIQQVEDKIKSFVDFKESEIIDSNIIGSLSGIPVLVKDNICVKGNYTTCASKILSGFRSVYDATVVKKLKASGAVILGRANMDEFAFGSSCENSTYYPTRNPWELDRVPGGSSGGSAAAVASDETIMALGSDTGGSIRQPASFCSVVGLKPTYGRVSRYGLVAFASSLDQIGPLTKDVTDAALLLNTIAGHDEMDSTSLYADVPDYTKSLTEDIKKMTIGIPKEYFIEGIAKDVKDATREAIEVLKKKGAKIKEISLPHTEYAVSVYYIIATAEASSNLARFDGVKYGLRVSKDNNKELSLKQTYFKTRGDGFGNEAKRRIILGTYVLSHGYYDAYYLRAQKVRTLIKKDFLEAFKEVDCIVTPTSPTASFRLGERIQNPLSMYLSDIFTISANLAGIPAISVPCGFTKDKLPIGLQFLTNMLGEEMLFKAAFSYEQSTNWHKEKPNLK